VGCLENNTGNCDYLLIELKHYHRPFLALLEPKILKQLSSRYSKKIKKNKIKLPVNTGQVMFSGEIYYY